ncbi:MAG TPA: 50S ribosomal protein L1 [Nitrospiraceae bacterium]|nr:50S ribosomal protein L1 [Nitrospiraceae bacterium]
MAKERKERMMAGKKMRAAKAKIQPRYYGLKEAVGLVKQAAHVKFDESVDLALRLGVDPKRSDQMVRGTTALPHGSGKKVRILVFAKGEKEQEARQAGAEYVGSDDLMEKIKGGWMDFDQAIATPDLMGSVGKLGKILGPRGLMPNPKSGTVTFEVGKAIADIRKGRVEYKVEKAGIIHAPVGKVSFDEQRLYENAQAIIESVIKARPASVKGRYLKSATISSTMGPGVRLDPVALTKQVEQSKVA